MVLGQHRFAPVLGRADPSSCIGRLVSAYFGSDRQNPALYNFFDAVFPVDCPLVFLPHHGLFVSRWVELARSRRMYACTPSNHTVCVRYTCRATQINGQPLIGTQHYPAVMALEVISALLTSTCVESVTRMASVCDIPKNLVEALLLSTTPRDLYKQFFEQWIDLDAYDRRFMDIYRNDPSRFNQFYVEPVCLPGADAGAMNEYTKLVSTNRLGEQWSSQQRQQCAGTSLVVTLYLFFDLEAERIKNQVPPHQMDALRVESLQKLFPMALWLAIDSEPQYANEYCERIVSEAPVVAEMMQHFIDATRMFLVDQVRDPSEFRDEIMAAPLWKSARSVYATLRNIRVCIDPHIEALERFQSASLTQASAATHSRDGRSQRMQHFAADRRKLDEFLYDVLIDELCNMVEVRAILGWMYMEAYRLSRSARQQECTREQTYQTPKAEAVRAMIGRISRHFVVLTFFGRDGWQQASLFSLRCTTMAINNNYPEIGLSQKSSHYLGHCQHGPYLVMERLVLWMTIHATNTLALTSRPWCYNKTTPIYGELLRTYFTRLDTRDEVAEALRANPTPFNFLWNGDGLSMSQPPSKIDPNVFSHMCFVNTFCEWMGVPTELLRRYETDDIRWRLAVPPPSTPAFAITRMLHRVTDILYQGGVAVLTRARRGYCQYWLDDDDSALNAIRSFLQLEAPHTVSIRTLQDLAIQFTQNMSFLAEHTELAQLIEALDFENTDCARACVDWFEEVRKNDYDLHYTLNPFMKREVASAVYATNTRRHRRLHSDESGNITLVSSPGGKRSHAQSSASDAKPSSSSRTHPSHARRASSYADESNLLEITASHHNKTDTITAEIVLGKSLHTVDDETRCCTLNRVALLPTQQLLRSLPEKHSVRRLYEYGASPRQLLAHINLLFYGPVLRQTIGLIESRRVLCDLKVGGAPLRGATLFKNARYKGSRQQALQHFREMHTHCERLILTVSNDPTGRILAYNTQEPRDQFYALLRHLDYRYTVGDADPGQKINAAIDCVLASSASPSTLLSSSAVSKYRSTDDDEDLSLKSRTNGNSATPNEMPVCMSTNNTMPHLYPSNSMVLITTLVESQVSDCFGEYRQHWEFASHLAAIIGIDHCCRRMATCLYTVGDWKRSVESRIRRRQDEIEEAQFEDEVQMKAAVQGGLESVKDYLDLWADR